MTGHEGRVVRVADDPARGRYVLQGQCSCGSWSSDRVVVRARSDRLDAPATNEVGRAVARHVDEALALPVTVTPSR